VDAGLGSNTLKVFKYKYKYLSILIIQIQLLKKYLKYQFP